MAYHEYKRMELLLYHLNMKKTILYHNLFTLSQFIVRNICACLSSVKKGCFQLQSISTQQDSSAYIEMGCDLQQCSDLRSWLDLLQYIFES
jgi:hypothetical protein